MSFATEIAKSVNDPRVLFEFDVGQLNIQWINIGAGIWECNASNLYSYVDSTLMPDDYSAQDFGIVGSVEEDGILLTEKDTLAELTTAESSFFYNKSTRSLYCAFDDFNEPWISTIRIGVINGYAFTGFTPTDTQESPYDGRLLSLPNISVTRDPLFYGKLSHPGGMATLGNTDGELDTFGEDNNAYGNPARILLGYESISLPDYQDLFHGAIGRVVVSEHDVSVEIIDQRAQLTRPITYSCSNANALDTIKDILTTYFPISYTDTYFDTTAWDAKTASVENVTITMQEPKSAIEVIGWICTSVFGFFDRTAAGLYTFKTIDTSASASTTIFRRDILNSHRIPYDPKEVISSVRIGHSKDWLTAGTAYSYYTDDDRETSVYNMYGVYKEQEILTVLPDETRAASLATRVLDYFDEVHGRDVLSLPMAYYALAVGDIVDVEVDRLNSTMLGTKKSEIIGITYSLKQPKMSAAIRFV